MATLTPKVLFRLEVKLSSGIVEELPIKVSVSARDAAAAFASEHGLPSSQQQALQRTIQLRMKQHEMQTAQSVSLTNVESTDSHALALAVKESLPASDVPHSAAFDGAARPSSSLPDSPTMATSRGPGDALRENYQQNDSQAHSASSTAGQTDKRLVDVSSKRLHDASVAGVLSLLCANANESATRPTNLIIDIQYNNVSSVAQLVQGLASNVCELRAGHNNLSGSLAPLASLSNLHMLRLPGNALTKLAGLSLASQLVHLDISCNRVVSLSGLEALRCLATLDARSNMIASLQALRPLSHCPRLQSVLLSGNPVCPAGAAALADPPLALEGTPHMQPAVRKYRSRLLALLPTLTHLDGLPTAPSSTRYRGSSPRRAAASPAQRAGSPAVTGGGHTSGSRSPGRHTQQPLQASLSAASAPVGSVSRGAHSGAVSSLRPGQPPAATSPPSAAQAAAAAASTATSAAIAAIDAATARRLQAQAPTPQAAVGGHGSDAEREESPRSAPRPHRASPPVTGAVKTYHPAALGSPAAPRPGAVRVAPSSRLSGYAQRRAAVAAGGTRAPSNTRRHASGNTPALFGAARRQGGGARDTPAVPPAPAGVAAPPQVEAAEQRYSGSPAQGAQPRIQVRAPKLRTSQRAVARDPHGKLHSAQQRSAGDAGYAHSQRRAKAQTRGAQAEYRRLVAGRTDGYMHETAAWTQRKGVQGGLFVHQGDARYASAAAANAASGGNTLSATRDTSAHLASGDAPVLGLRESPTPLTPGDMRLRVSKADALWMGMLRAPAAAAQVWPVRAPQPVFRQAGQATLDAEVPTTPAHGHAQESMQQAPFKAQDMHDASMPSPVPAATPSPEPFKGAGPLGRTPAASPGQDDSAAPSLIDSFVAQLPVSGPQCGSELYPPMWQEPPPQWGHTQASTFLSVPAVGQFGQAVAAAAAASSQSDLQQPPPATSASPPQPGQGHPYGQLLDTSGVSAVSSSWNTPARMPLQQLQQSPAPAGTTPAVAPPAAAARGGPAVSRGGGNSLRAAMGNLLATKQKLMATLGRS